MDPRLDHYWRKARFIFIPAPQKKRRKKHGLSAWAAGYPFWLWLFTGVVLGTYLGRILW